MSTRFVSIWLFLVIFGSAAISRIHSLDARPLHADEAVQGMKLVHLLETGEYRYDPSHFHGPTLYYLSVPIAAIAGGADKLEARHLRLLPALAGILACAAPVLLQKRLGWSGTLGACALISFSPGLVYYSRYYVQEILLVCFLLWAFACGLRAWWSRGSVVWSLLTGVFAGLAVATKESWALVVLSAIPSATVLLIVSPRSNRPSLRELVQVYWPSMATALSVAILFYSSFFTNPQGIIDSVLTFFSYELSGGHEKPWSYYAGLLLGHGSGTGEIAVVIALLLAIGGCIWLWLKERKGAGLGLAMIVFTLVYLVIQSCFAYKNPWLLLVPLASAALAFGFVLGRMEKPQRRVLSTIVLTLAMFLAHPEATRVSLTEPVGERNPYAYAPTLPAAQELADAVRAEAQSGRPVQVIMTNYWPLPWMLRDLPSVGYWQDLPVDLEDVRLVVAETRHFIPLQVQMGPPATMRFYEIRPGEHVVLYRTAGK